MVGRPRKDRRGKARSIYFSPSSEAFLETSGQNDNLSEFINALIQAAAESSPVMMAISIERLSREIAALEEKLLSARTERDMLQAQLNITKERRTGDDRQTHEARMALLRKWDQAQGRSGMFRDWITGPANMGLIGAAGFATAEDAVSWCTSESRRR